jgi:hypothetical protein
MHSPLASRKGAEWRRRYKASQLSVGPLPQEQARHLPPSIRRRACTEGRESFVGRCPSATILETHRDAQRVVGIGREQFLQRSAGNESYAMDTSLVLVPIWHGTPTDPQTPVPPSRNSEKYKPAMRGSRRACEAVAAYWIGRKGAREGVPQRARGGSDAGDGSERGLSSVGDS